MSENIPSIDGSIELRPNAVVTVSNLIVKDREVLVALQGQIKFEASDPLAVYFDQVMDKHAPETLTIDCRNLYFIDSQGLAMILQLNNRCMKQNCKVVLQNPSANLRNLLKLTRIDQLLSVV